MSIAYICPTPTRPAETHAEAEHRKMLQLIGIACLVVIGVVIATFGFWFHVVFGLASVFMEAMFVLSVVSARLACQERKRKRRIEEARIVAEANKAKNDGALVA